MNRHQLTNSDQHPYACDVCEKTFNQKVIIKKHIHIHSAKCLYARDFCNKTVRHM